MKKSFYVIVLDIVSLSLLDKAQFNTYKEALFYANSMKCTTYEVYIKEVITKTFKVK